LDGVLAKREREGREGAWEGGRLTKRKGEKTIKNARERGRVCVLVGSCVGLIERWNCVAA